MKFIGLAGPAGVGKDTVADYLVETYGFTKFSFSDLLYREVAEAFKLDESVLRDRTTKEQPLEALTTWNCGNHDFSRIMFTQIASEGIAKYPAEYWCSPRQVLQWWGTEYRRAQDPDYWVKQTALWVEAWRDVTRESDARRGRASAGIVNTSVRFENERAFVRSMNGVVWHIQRPAEAREGVASQLHHPAEKGLEPEPQDSVIVNKGSIEELRTAASLMLQSEPGTTIVTGISFDPEDVKEVPPEERYVTCTGCGWVHVGYSEAEASEEVDTFNAFLASADEATRALYTGGPASLDSYRGCFRCKGTTFRRSKAGDCPDGVTLPPVICESTDG